MPENKTEKRTAVIICPGGGYGALMMDYEGTEIAEKFNKLGVAAFVLKYRLPDDRISLNKSIAPLQDSQQAILTVRESARKWGVNPHKVGIMGFSASGHLASTAGTHFTKSHIQNEGSITLRPDFMILVFPVISMQTDLTHAGSRENLLDPNPSEEQINLFSNESR